MVSSASKPNGARAPGRHQAPRHITSTKASSRAKRPNRPSVSQFAAIQKNLGPLLNGIVNYDFWVPEPTLSFPGVNEFLAKYRVAAAGKGVDPFGHYLPPFAYAYLQVLEQSVNAVKSLDQAKLADHMRKTTFDTVVGGVKFGRNGEWATSRVLMVQFRNVQKDNLEQFVEPGKRIVLYPKAWKSGEIAYPYKQ